MKLHFKIFCLLGGQSLPMRGAWIEIRLLCGHIARSSRRSPCGERGLKCIKSSSIFWLVCRSPCGERGLKSRIITIFITRIMSLPMRGAWIEIHFGVVSPDSRLSLPMRGAWIEIMLCAWRSWSFLSLPMRGAWIEITPGPFCGHGSARRSPCGERGLKYP